MELGLLILALIIVLDLAAMYFVMNMGSKHDSHTEIRSPESSRAVQLLMKQDELARQRREKAAQPAGEMPGGTVDAPAMSKSAGTAASSPLGSDEDKAKRREAALARKAARQGSTTTTASE
ncbi:MAG: hypothetical protein OHK0046_19310 [Anaerolineae bacterium]